MPTSVVPADRFAAAAELHRLERRWATGSASDRDLLVLRMLRRASYAESFPTSYPPAVVAASQAVLIACGHDVLSTDFHNAIDALAAATH